MGEVGFFYGGGGRGRSKKQRDRRRDLPGQLATQLINLSHVPTGTVD